MKPALLCVYLCLGAYVHLGVWGVCVAEGGPQVWGVSLDMGRALPVGDLGLELVSLFLSWIPGANSRFSSGPQFP